MVSAADGLRVDEVTWARGGFGLKVSVAANPGEVIAVLGPNGSGKSTLLQLIAGVLRPDAGVIRWRGRELSGPQVWVPPPQRRVGLLGQDPLLFPHLSVRENVAFGPRARRLAHPLARAGEWLERLAVSQLANRKPSALSGGQAARVAIARALAGEPELLLLDEPLAALDAAAAPQLRQVLAAAVSHARITTVLVSHDVLDAAILADRIVVLRDGQVVEQGSRQAVLAAPRTEFTAAFMGINLISDQGLEGAGEVTGRVRFRPSAVKLAAQRRWQKNVWQARVRWLEPAAGGVRVRLAPIPGPSPDLLADLDPASFTPVDAERGWLRPGALVWAHVPPEALERVR